jgi:hypothetical protein
MSGEVAITVEWLDRAVKVLARHGIGGLAHFEDPPADADRWALLMIAALMGGAAGWPGGDGPFREALAFWAHHGIRAALRGGGAT